MCSMSRINHLFLICLCLASNAAGAQTKDAPKVNVAPVATAPERTAASFGDWILRCETVVAPAKRICELAQIIAPQGQTNPIAQVALGKLAANELSRLTVMLVPNIAISARPQIAVAKSGGVSVELSWQSCTPGGCSATAAIADDTVRTFSAQTEPGRVSFRDGTGRDVVLPLSFRGLAQACCLVKGDLM